MTRPLRTDIVAGLTTAAVVIPKSMGFAAIAGLPLEVGLYTSLVPLVVYAALGTSRALSVTTTSTLAILVAGALAPLAGADSAHLLTAASSLALMVGLVLLLASALRLGFLADFISAPVLTGFKAGIAIVIVVDQIPKLLGIHFAKGTFLQSLGRIVTHVPETSMATLALAVALLALIVVLERIASKWPAPLVAVAAAIAVSSAFGLQRFGIELVGQVRPGLPSLALPDVSLAWSLAPAALGIALMSFVETAAAGRAFVQKGEPMPAENRELLALGLANVAGSLFHNMPAGGGTSQTAVNRAAGARTQLAGLTTAVAVLATLLFLAPMVALMPQAALAAVVVTTSVGLFRPSDFAAIRRVRAREFGWAVAATTGVVLLGTLNGILVAVALSVTALFYESCRPPVYLLGRKRGTDVFEPVSTASSELETFPGLLLVRTEAILHFANVHSVGAEMWRLVGHSQPHVLAFDMSAVPDLEYTALQGLLEVDDKLRGAGTELWLVAMNARVREVIDRSPFADARRQGRLFDSAGEALEAYVRGGRPAASGTSS